MKTIEYFKLQAKNLHKDFKTQKSYYDPEYGRNLYKYAPRYFDINALIVDYDIDEENFSLMKAQHYIAQLAGFRKWTEMLKANPAALELSKLLFDNMHKISVDEWDIYISGVERDNGFKFDDELKLDIFKTVFDEVDDHQSDGWDYRWTINERISEDTLKLNTELQTGRPQTTVQILELPLAESDRKEFIEVANKKFDGILEMIENKHPQLVRELWNPKEYIGKVLKPDMLPINRDDALSLVEAFLIHHVIGLATEADKQAINLN